MLSISWVRVRRVLPMNSRAAVLERRRRPSKVSDGSTLRQVIQSVESGIQGFQMLPVERCQTGTKMLKSSA